MKKLWRVSVEGECYVWADDEHEAEEEVQHAVSSYSAAEAGMADYSSTPMGVEDLPSIPEEWKHCIPFGTPPEGYEDKSIEDALEQMQEEEPPPPHPDQTSLFDEKDDE